MQDAYDSVVKQTHLTALQKSHGEQNKSPGVNSLGHRHQFLLKVSHLKCCSFPTTQPVSERSAHPEILVALKFRKVNSLDSARFGLSLSLLLFSIY